MKAKICKEKDLNKMLWCEEFGIIDDNLGFVTLDTKNPHAAVLVNNYDNDVVVNKGNLMQGLCKT